MSVVELSGVGAGVAAVTALVSVGTGEEEEWRGLRAKRQSGAVLCAKLADLGASVVKIEPLSGDPMCVCAPVDARACACACVRVCACACVCVCVCVRCVYVLVCERVRLQA